MKKTKGFIYFLVLLFLSPLVILSCNDFSDSSQNDSTQTTKSSKNTVTFIGEFSLDGALPSEIADALNNKETAARSAVPSVPSDVTFYAKASALEKEDKVISNDDFDKTGTNKITFNLPLDTEIEWTIEAGIKNGETIILKDSCTVTLNANQPVFSHIFILKPDTNSTGDIDLSINVCEGVKKLKITSDNNNWPNDLKEISFQGSNTYSLSKSEVKSGIYSTVFYFYGEDDILLYSTTQNITVFSGMTTKTWVSDGSGVIKGGEFELSQDLITQFTRTTFYVGSTSVGTASDETGSVYSPLASVTKAASIIAAAGDSSKDYRIYVCGEVTGAQKISEAINGRANSITIEGLNGLDENLEPNDVLDGNKNGTTLTINSSVPVTIKNLKITGGTGTSVNGTLCGGGIYTGDTASLYLESGALVTGNTAEDGGGVYSKGRLYFSAGGISQNIAEEYGGGVYSTGSVFMYGSAVIGDKSKTSAATESDYSNKAGSKGAGIYSTGNLYLGYSSWTSESENTPASLTGGVFYNFSPDVGGIYQYADNTSYPFKMDSGSVSYNAGCGIYVGKCTFTMTGGTVKGNTAIKGSDLDTAYQLHGAGLYARDEATVIISDGTITENHAEGNGGGLYGARDSSVIILEGGTISGNSADGQGNGIAIANGSLKMKGNASVDSSNDVYLESGKTITITDSLIGTAPVATITPASYADGTIVLEAVEGVNLADEVEKFTVTQYVSLDGSSRKDYSLDSEGKLHEGLSLPSSADGLASGKTYAVADSSDMQKLAEFSSNGYEFSGVTLKLGADITIGTAWTPIGNSTAFSGTFDGNEKTVTFDSGEAAEAFFGTVNGTVKNLKVAGSTSVAGIAKKANTSAVIENCENLAAVTSTEQYCAGIVAEVSGATIKGCVNKGTVISNYDTTENTGINLKGAGGITGPVKNGGVVDSCTNTGSVTAGLGAGGISSQISYTCTIRNSQNSGDITSTRRYAGGIVGVASGSGDVASHIDNCFNSGSVTASGTTETVYAGGIAGVLGWGSAAWAQNCLNIGNVSISESAKSDSSAGALIGCKDSFAKIDFCYYKEGCAGSSFGTGGSSGDTMNECIKATQSGSGDAVISVSVTVSISVSGTIDSFSYTANWTTVCEPLNKWVDINNSDNLYLEWETDTNHWPKLKLQ